MSKSAINFAAGVLVGIAGIVCWEVVQGAEPPVEVDNMALERGQAETIELLKEVSYKLNRLSEAIAFTPEAGNYSSTVDADVSESSEVGTISPVTKVPVPPAIAKKYRADPRLDNWTSFIDKDLVKILIQNGLTPFDHGVAQYLHPCSEKLTSMKETGKTEERKLREKYPGVQRDGAFWTEYIAELNKIWEKSRNDRKTTMDEFRKNIKSLRK